MTNTNPEQRVAAIARRYLEDDEFIHVHRQHDPQRLASIAEIQTIIGRFVTGDSNLRSFRDQLDAHLRKPENDLWGTRGFWMMTLNQLINSHDQLAEAELRKTLSGLNATNVGERFEGFARFLASEKRRFPQKGNKLAAPGRSPFIVSLFAQWLDPEGGVIVIWPTMREGLRALMDLSALPAATQLTRTWDGVRIATAQDYEAALLTLQSIAALEPRITTATKWWDERFLEWVRQRQQEIPEWIEVLQPTTQTFPDTHLVPIPTGILTQRIIQLQRELLISEDVIRRIYHALVLGHNVILSGPPGTGKTQLATLLPTLLWKYDEPGHQHIPSSYLARVVTATDEWTPRHVIGGIVPVAQGGQVTYQIAYGYLASAIMDNWNLDVDIPTSWESPARRTVAVRGAPTEHYRGCWLVIDEFNRAPIDLALGEAMTALSEGIMALSVPTLNGPTLLPIPQDFRIIGTLNTFDRHFLNQISEALKRRFAFIEVLPPPRREREAEQGMVMRRVLERLQPISAGRIREDCREWKRFVNVIEEPSRSLWRCEWLLDTAVARCFDEGWRLFEIIRLYRQFGTAQAIGWATHYLGAGLLDELDPVDEDGWHRCLDYAFADTLADQLQILFPDELEVLSAYLQTNNAQTFQQAYNQILSSINGPKRRGAQMIALQSVRDDQGRPLFPAAEARDIIEDERLSVSNTILSTLFYADQRRGLLPTFQERLERLIFERNI